MLWHMERLRKTIYLCMAKKQVRRSGQGPTVTWYTLNGLRDFLQDSPQNLLLLINITINKKSSTCKLLEMIQIETTSRDQSTGSNQWAVYGNNRNTWRWLVLWWQKIRMNLETLVRGLCMQFSRGVYILCLAQIDDSVVRGSFHPRCPWLLIISFHS